MIQEKMLEERKKLENQLQEIYEQLEQLPEGQLCCSHNGNSYKWYISTGKTQTYLPKTQRTLAEKLALKKYLTALSKDLLKKLSAIDGYLKQLPSDTKYAANLLINNSEYRKLTAPFFTPLSEELRQWSDSSYEKNAKYPEQLIHKAASGNMLRSKSEAIIDTFLYLNRIPFRYECSLILGNTIIFPDFTIRHPETGDIFYWEHFGLMDELSYCNNFLSKLQLYTSNGIIPSIQLITTYETKEHPLNSDMVEKIIHYYFL